MADETTTATASETASATPSAAAQEPEKAAVPKFKTRKPKQRACDEKDEKNKLCAGHLKRWFDYPAEVQAVVGKDAEIYRCEFCKTIYRPDPKQQPNSYTVRY